METVEVRGEVKACKRRTIQINLISLEKGCPAERGLRLI